jgi:uridine kinase
MNETKWAIASDLIIEKLQHFQHRPIVISIAGESGSGKTTLSHALSFAIFEKGHQVLILHQDDYFKLPPLQNHNARVKDFNHIGPQEVDAETLQAHISVLKANAANKLSIPKMDWAKDVREYKEVDVSRIEYVIVEGTYTTLLPNVDLKVFMTDTYKDTKQNRIKRNRETVTDFIEKVLEKESNIIQSHKSLAHLYVNHECELFDQDGIHL